MKRYLILIFGIITLISCKEQIAKTLIDASKMTVQTKYFYEYKSDRLISQTEKTYTIMFGQVMDSMISQTNFVYNDKNFLIQEIDKLDYEEKPTIKIYDYDTNDSLISKMSINPENDTTFWEVYKYFPDGKKTVFHRFLSIHLDPNQDFIEAMENKKLDTLFDRNEYKYIDNVCKIQRKYDIKGNLIKTVNIEYKGNKLFNETHLTYFNGIEMTEKIKFYDYSKSDTKPDFYSLNFNKDTIEFCVNEFDKDQLLYTTNLLDKGNLLYKSTFENGKEIKVISFDKLTNSRSIELRDYYKNGDLKELKSYIEGINAH